jgi:3-oxoadipate enol-lactonase
MPRVRAGEIELDYERSGSGPPLLAIMGMSGTSLHWREPFLAPLREDFDVIVYDHRGVGDSSPLRGATSIVEMADDAAALLDALEIDSAHVLGISMGGMIAQELALAYPERVRTLTLGCTYCGGEGSALTSPQVLQRLTEATMSGDQMLALRAAFEANISPAAATDGRLYRDLLTIAAQRAVAVPVIMAQMQACMAHDASSRLAQLTMPTLVIHGTEDQMLPVANARAIASRIPGAQLEILDGAGHLFFWEQPDAFVRIVKEFLQ